MHGRRNRTNRSHDKSKATAKDNNSTLSDRGRNRVKDARIASAATPSNKLHATKAVGTARAGPKKTTVAPFGIALLRFLLLFFVTAAAFLAIIHRSTFLATGTSNSSSSSSSSSGKPIIEPNKPALRSGIDTNRLFRNIDRVYSNSSNSNRNFKTIRKMSSTAARIRSSASTRGASAETVRSVVEHLRETVGINFLALDFDQTILDIHTGGAWKGSLEELFPHVRPLYSQLILEALDCGMEVAVVTFSCQTRFVRGVLDHIVGGNGDPLHHDTSHKIPIRGGDRSWRYSGSGSREGKQQHMASAVEELEARREEEYQEQQQQQRKQQQQQQQSGESKSSNAANLERPAPITRKTTLLLDDDARNIQHALRNGTRAVWFNPKRPELLLPELAKLV